MIILCESNTNLLSPEILTVLSTVLLTLITAFYAYWTYQMAKVNKREFEISNRPYLSVMTMDENIENNVLFIKVSIKNSGKIPAIMTSSEVIAYNEDKTVNKSLGKSISTIIINPGEFMAKNMVTIDDYTIPQKLTFEFIIKYKSPVQNVAVYLTKYRYSFDSTKNFKISIIDTEIN